MGKSNVEKGCLYVIATPIGHLGDLSPRAIEILGGVDGIVYESRQQALKLLGHYGIDTRLLGKVTDHQGEKEIERLLEDIQRGLRYAYVSDAGTPVVSDPGKGVVCYAQKVGVQVVPIPGPSAVTAALSVCGFSATPFSFYGFFPEKLVQKKQILQEMVQKQEVSIFFESPHRIESTLSFLADSLPEGRKVCIARELTKLYEQVLVVKAGDLKNIWDTCVARGEFVVVVDRALESDVSIDSDKEAVVRSVIENMSVGGFSSKDVAKALEVTRVWSKNKIYTHYLEVQKKMGNKR